MLVNSKSIDTSISRVKFVSYTGKWPNLCGGVLTLEIDGKEYKFGHNYGAHDWGTNTFKDEDPNAPNFQAFWSSGGCVSHNDDWNFDVNYGDWIINVDDLPTQFKDIAFEIDTVFNANVPQGCCGGCI